MILCRSCRQPCTGEQIVWFTGPHAVRNVWCERCDVPPLAQAASLHGADLPQAVEAGHDAHEPRHALGVGTLVDVIDFVHDGAPLTGVHANQPARQHEAQPPRGFLHSIFRRVRSLAAKPSASALHSHSDAPASRAPMAQQTIGEPADASIAKGQIVHVCG